MSHNSKKLRWALTFISLLYTFDTAISKQLLRSDDSRRYCRHESINRCSLEYIKRTRLASSGNLLTSVNGLTSSASVLSTHHGGDDGHYRVKHDAATIAQTKRKHISSCSNIHHRRTAIPSAFVSINNHSGASKISAKSLTKQPTTTTLHLKFKTFEEMIHHHHSTPLLIDFYAPWCGPCKLMKGEISSIRDQLDLLGPAVQVVQEQEEEEEEEEDCSVEDVIALSSVCLEDGYIEEQQLSEGLSSSLGKEDTTSLLKDLLPPPPPTTTTKDTTQSTTKQPPQSTTTLPSGIPVYHVNTNKFPQVGAKNHIAGLPTLVLFYEGEELWRNEGLMKGEEIVSVLSELQEGGWKRKREESSVVEVCREEEESSSSVDKKKKEEKVNAVVVAAAGEVDKKKKKRKGRRLGG